MKPKIIIFRQNALAASETFIEQQILSYKKWEPILFCKKIVHELPLINLTVKRFDRPIKSLKSRITEFFSSGLGEPSKYSISQLKMENPKLIHAHFGMDATSIYPSSNYLGIPLVVTLHGYDITTDFEWWKDGYGGLRLRHYPARLLMLSKQPKVFFIAVSEYIRQVAIKKGLPADRIFVKYIGIDTDKFNPGKTKISDREPQILFVGRLVEKKGCEYLIRAFSLVREKILKSELIIAGYGPLLPKLKSLANELKVPVRFIGSVSSEKVKLLLNDTKVFCLPSITANNGDAEGFGLVILEAQACGVPVVTSATGGATEGIKEGETGFPFVERDIESLANRIISILANGDLANSMGVAGVNFVKEKFDTRNCTSSLENFYDQIIDSE